jgi:hypothetical protein
MPGSSLFSSCSGGGRIEVVESLAGLKKNKKVVVSGTEERWKAKEGGS